MVKRVAAAPFASCSPTRNCSVGIGGRPSCNVGAAAGTGCASRWLIQVSQRSSTWPARSFGRRAKRASTPRPLPGRLTARSEFGDSREERKPNADHWCRGLGCGRRRGAAGHSGRAQVHPRHTALPPYPEHVNSGTGRWAPVRLPRPCAAQSAGPATGGHDTVAGAAGQHRAGRWWPRSFSWHGGHNHQPSAPTRADSGRRRRGAVRLHR